MKIGELSRRSGLSTHTIRYYERIGLLPETARTAARHRDYDESALTRIALLDKLKKTGMPIRDLIRYIRLVEAGETTHAERHALLSKHRDRVVTQLADLESCLLFLDQKLDLYAAMERRARTKQRTVT